MRADDTTSDLLAAVKVFYSYAHRDEEYREELGKHLSMLARAGLIAEWHDRCIKPGDLWAGEIDQNLEQADVILLLVSSDFLASDYCFDIELKRAMERHEEGKAIVVPIIVRPVSWQTAPFGKLQALPKDGRAVGLWDNSDAAWASVADGIHKVIDKARERVAASQKIVERDYDEGSDEDFDPPTIFQSMLHKDPSEFVIVVESGPMKGLSLTPTAEDKITIGRSDQCQIRLATDDNAASRLHACIEFKVRDFVVYDLKSKNGTFVNGKRIRARRLSAGDQITCGHTNLRLDLAPDPDRTLTVMAPRAVRDQLK